MTYYRNDCLMHYGVKGMKWGVRKDTGRSMRGNVHRALAGVYGVNERFYSKRNGRRSKNLASMNAKERKNQLAIAEKYDKQKAQEIAKRKAEGKKEDAQTYKYNKSNESGLKGATRAISANKKKLALGAIATASMFAAAGAISYGTIKMDKKNAILREQVRNSLDRNKAMDAKIAQLKLEKAALEGIRNHQKKGRSNPVKGNVVDMDTFVLNVSRGLDFEEYASSKNPLGSYIPGTPMRLKRR